MTFYEVVWQAAADTFGKKRGHANPLTPYTRTWKLVIGRADHALWVWNEKHGPLNQKQREYAAELVAWSLKKAQEAPDCNAVYAYFNTNLTHLLNHERTAQGFKSRDETPAEAAVDLSGMFGRVAA